MDWKVSRTHVKVLVWTWFSFHVNIGPPRWEIPVSQKVRLRYVVGDSRFDGANISFAVRNAAFRLSFIDAGASFWSRCKVRFRLVWEVCCRTTKQACRLAVFSTVATTDVVSGDIFSPTKHTCWNDYDQWPGLIFLENAIETHDQENFGLWICDCILDYPDDEMFDVLCRKVQKLDCSYLSRRTTAPFDSTARLLACLYLTHLRLHVFFQTQIHAWIDKSACFPCTDTHS